MLFYLFNSFYINRLYKVFLFSVCLGSFTEYLVNFKCCDE